MAWPAIHAACAGPRSAPSRAKTVRPLGPCVHDGFGDDVGGVVLSSAGHGDVGGRCGGVLADHDVRGVDGLALGAVGGAGVGELDVLVDILSREDAAAVAVGHVEAPVRVDRGDPPGFAVGDVEVAVVAAGGDPVADADALTA